MASNGSNGSSSCADCDTNNNNTSTNTSEVHIDACPEDGQIISSGEDELIDFNVFAKPRTQQETAVDRDVVTNPSHAAQGNNLHDYLPHFPKHLREEYIDFLVIHTDEDYDDAKELKDKVEQNVKFCEDLTPNVTLLKDIVTDFPVIHLDYAFSRSHYILMFVTKNFCADMCKLSESYSCLERAFNSPEERKAIISVHTCSRQNRNYELPMLLGSLRPLNYFSKTFVQDVTKLLEHKSDLILERKINLEKERQEYFNANFAEKTVPVRKCERPSMSNSRSKYEKSPKTSFDKDQTKAWKNDPTIQQKMSQYSVSKEQNSVMSLENDLSSIEADRGEVLTVSSRSRPKPDGNEAVPFDIPSQVHSTHAKAAFSDVSGQSLNQRQNVQQGCSSSHTSIDQTKKVANESGYYSSALEGSTVSFSSLPEPDDNKAVPINVPAQVYSRCVQASSKQSMSNSVGIESHVSHQSVQSDNNENIEDPSTDGNHAHESTLQAGLTKSSSAHTKIYNITINSAEIVSINSTVDFLKSRNKHQDTDDTSDDDFLTPENKM